MTGGTLGVILGIRKYIWRGAKNVDVDGWMGLVFYPWEVESRCIWGERLPQKLPEIMGSSWKPQEGLEAWNDPLDLIYMRSPKALMYDFNL